MEKKYRAGLIGVGSIAHIAHLPILAARNDVEMAGAFAEHIGSVQLTQKSYAIQHAVHNMDELLSLIHIFLGYADHRARRLQTDRFNRSNAAVCRLYRAYAGQS